MPRKNILSKSNIRKTPPKRIYLLLRLIQDNITYHPAFMVIRSILIRSTSGVYPLMILPSTCLNANICRYRQDKLIIHRSAPIGSMTNHTFLFLFIIAVWSHSSRRSTVVRMYSCRRSSSDPLPAKRGHPYDVCRRWWALPWSLDRLRRHDQQAKAETIPSGVRNDTCDDQWRNSRIGSSANCTTYNNTVTTFPFKNKRIMAL